MMPAGANLRRGLSPRRVALQHFLTAQGELVDCSHNLAHFPWQRLADHRFQILVHQDKTEATRSQGHAPFAFRCGIGIGDQSHIAQLQRGQVAGQQFHLADEVGVCRTVGKHHDRALHIQQIGEDHLGRVARAIGFDLH